MRWEVIVSGNMDQGTMHPGRLKKLVLNHSILSALSSIYCALFLGTNGQQDKREYLALIAFQSQRRGFSYVKPVGGGGPTC